MARFSKRTGKYRSKFESNFAANFPNLKYEATKIKYTVPASVHTYCPDWQVDVNKYLETKGIFGPKDRQKLLLMQAQHPEIDLALVFYHPHRTMGKRLGTPMEWGAKNNFTCFAGDDIEGIRRWIESGNDKSTN